MFRCCAKSCVRNMPPIRNSSNSCGSSTANRTGGPSTGGFAGWWKGTRRAGHASAGKGEAVCSIASSGGEVLLDRGENCLLGRDRPNGRHAERSVLHALGLNDIHLSALRVGVLVRWIGALEIRSQNELTGAGFAKDYDAILTVATGSGEHRFALEYERSPKTINRYRAIGTALHQESRVSRVLYLVTSHDLLRFVMNHVGKAQGRVYFGLARDWHRELLDMPVTSGLSTTPLRLRDALEGAAARLIPAPVAL